MNYTVLMKASAANTPGVKTFIIVVVRAAGGLPLKSDCAADMR